MANVFIAYCHPNTVGHNFFASVTRTLLKNHRERRHRIGICSVRGYPGSLDTARNKLTADFMDSDYEWYWSLDTDMGFLAETLDRLLETSGRYGDPASGNPAAVGAPYNIQFEPGDDGMGGPTEVESVPLAWLEYPTGYRAIGETIPRNKVIPVDGTGAGCLLVHRSAFEPDRLAEDWWSPVLRPGDDKPLGEDLSFCYRLKRNGIPLYVNSGIRTTHMKDHWI